jgi:flagellar hook assembly protein FlgD
MSKSAILRGRGRDVQRTLLIWLVISNILLAQATPGKPQQQPHPSSQGLSISEVAVSANSFNPSRNEKLFLSYRLSRDAKVTVKVFDPDRQLVRVIIAGALRKAGTTKDSWDGRDSDGKVVPNEAYFFNVEAQDSAGGKVVYDPITFSGGEFGDITRGQLDRETGTLSYKLSQPSRVLLRAGMSSGLLLKTIVDWEPRSSGTITEYWNGKDEDGLFDVTAMKGTTMVLTYMTLPENSVITIGNDKLSYRVYKRMVSGQRPMKEDRAMANARKISPHFLKSRITDRAFGVKINFPDFDKAGNGNIPTIKDSALFQLSVADQDREVLAGQQFEIMVHIDTAFLFEEERGYLPFNTPLEVKAIPPGEHTLTVNLITFGDQIAVGSRKFRVVR